MTIYTEALKNKGVMMSASTGPNPFALSSGFSKPVQETRAITRFEGNVNFEQEARRTNFRETNKDFTQNNPNLYSAEPEVDSFAHIKE